MGPVIYGGGLSEVREHLSSKNWAGHLNARGGVSKFRMKSWGTLIPRHLDNDV